MLKASIPLCTLLLALSITACSKEESQAPTPASTPAAAPAADTQAESQAIRDGETAWAKEWQAKDADKIVSHYAPDAVLLVTDRPAMNGTDAIKSGIGGMLKDPHLSLTFAPTLVVVAQAGAPYNRRTSHIRTYEHTHTHTHTHIRTHTHTHTRRLTDTPHAHSRTM